MRCGSLITILTFCTTWVRHDMSLLRLFLFFLTTATPPVARAWYIAPPASKSDWEQLARLLAERNQPRSEESTVAKLQWDLWGRNQAEDSLYRRYVRTARQLKGAKYDVLLAKEWGQVLGVAEMGIGDGGSDEAERRAILGVLCVSPEARRKGIGAALVRRCEEIATQVWQEETLWVEVETTNRQALRFFETSGYMDTEERSMVAVQRRQVIEETPHVVLSKRLVIHEDSVMERERA